jgi:hypothetical protein
MEDDKSKHFTVNVSEVSEEESLQAKPRLKRHASAQAVIQTDDWWLWELAGILISLAALAGIGALLSVLDDRAQPAWSYKSPAKKIGSISIPAVTVAVSPNTILSLLSTIGRIITRTLRCLRHLLILLPSLRYLHLDPCDERPSPAQMGVVRGARASIERF